MPITRARRLIAAALLLTILSTFVWPQAQKSSKTKPAAKPATKQVTLTLVRWPYT